MIEDEIKEEEILKVLSPLGRKIYFFYNLNFFGFFFNLGVATSKDSISSLCFSWTKKFEDDLRIAEDLRRKKNEKKKLY